jgi:hypothetical protein
MSTQSWQEAFLGVSGILGEPLDTSLAVVGDASISQVAGLLPALRSSSRDTRAHAMARTVTSVLMGLDEMRLR